MKFAPKLAVSVIAGVALGLFATWATVIHGPGPDALADGPWRTSLTIGSAKSGPYTRASVAIHGLLALNRSETICYTAFTDSSGATLDGACTYDIVGHDPDARWWSITAYGADDYLIPNPVDRYSISKNSVLRASDGSFSASVGSAAHVQNWIPTTREPFSLTLRLYNPGASVQSEPAQASLPVIVKEACS
jgi:hypothetical protein